MDDNLKLNDVLAEKAGEAIPDSYPWPFAMEDKE